MDGRRYRQAAFPAVGSRRSGRGLTGEVWFLGVFQKRFWETSQGAPQHITRPLASVGNFGSSPYPPPNHQPPTTNPQHKKIKYELRSATPSHTILSGVAFPPPVWSPHRKRLTPTKGPLQHHRLDRPRRKPRSRHSPKFAAQRRFRGGVSHADRPFRFESRRSKARPRSCRHRSQSLKTRRPSHHSAFRW